MKLGQREKKNEELFSMAFTNFDELLVAEGHLAGFDVAAVGVLVDDDHRRVGTAVQKADVLDAQLLDPGPPNTPFSSSDVKGRPLSRFQKVTTTLQPSFHRSRIGFLSKSICCSMSELTWMSSNGLYRVFTHCNDFWRGWISLHSILWYPSTKFMKGF